MNTQSRIADTYVYSAHPLVARMLMSSCESAGFPAVKVRLLTREQKFQLQQSSPLLVLDGCCDERWPELAVLWKKAGGRVLVLIQHETGHQQKQLQALFLGVSGVVTMSDSWQEDLRQAVEAVREGKLWVNHDALAEYVRRINDKNLQRCGDTNPGTGFTIREEQILGLLLRGSSNKEIGNILGITERTVKYHVSNILQKSQVSNRRELVSMMNIDKKQSMGAAVPVEFALAEAI